MPASGGGTAEVVGQKLAMLSRCHQIICITHLPQIAKFGNHHYKIEKQTASGRTQTTINELDPQSRVEEMAPHAGWSKNHPDDDPACPGTTEALNNSKSNYRQRSAFWERRPEARRSLPQQAVDKRRLKSKSGVARLSKELIPLRRDSALRAIARLDFRCSSCLSALS